MTVTPLALQQQIEALYPGLQGHHIECLSRGRLPSSLEIRPSVVVPSKPESQLRAQQEELGQACQVTSSTRALNTSG